MFKWILIIIAAFLGVWTFSKETIPESIRLTGAGKTLESVIFPLEYKVYGKNKQGKFSDKITPINDIRLTQVMESVDANPGKTVIFFYDTDSFLSRYMLYDINKLARDYTAQGVMFFVVAFENDSKRLDSMLDNFPKLYFRPIILPPNYMKTAEYFYLKKDLHVTDTPSILVKNKQGYKNIDEGPRFKEDVVTAINYN